MYLTEEPRARPHCAGIHHTFNAVVAARSDTDAFIKTRLPGGVLPRVTFEASGNPGVRLGPRLEPCIEPYLECSR